MSVQATQMTCAICDKQVAFNIARQDWWLCTICGSYVCPECYVLFRESGQDFCPGTIVRGVEQHSPHFTRFLAPRTTATPNVGEPPTVVMLGNVRRRTLLPTGGRVIILGDIDREEDKENHSTGNDDDS